MYRSIRVFTHLGFLERYTGRKKAECLVQRKRAELVDSTAIRCLQPENEPQDSRALNTKLCAAKAVSRIVAERDDRLQKAQGSHTEQEWQQVVAEFGNRCVRCTIRGEQTFYGRLTKDHVVPLSQGGTNYASNLQPLCEHCNSWKGSREIDFRTCSKKLLVEQSSSKRLRGEITQA